MFVITFAAVLGSIFIFGVWHSTASANREGFVKDGELQRLAGASRQAAHPPKYIIQALTILVRLHQSATQHVADTRFTYTLFALQPFASSDFVEDFHTQAAHAVAHLPGSENYTIDATSERLPSHKTFMVDLSAAAGERRTIVTPARYFNSLPLGVGRKIHGFIVGPREDAVCYPNVVDFIGELTIMVESDSLSLSTPTVGDAVTWTAGQEPKVLPAFLRTIPAGNEGILARAVVARWTNVVPGQTVGLKVRWDSDVAPLPIPGQAPPPEPASHRHDD